MSGAFERKSCIADAIGVRANHAPEFGCVVLIVVELFEAQYHIVKLLMAIGDVHFKNRSAEAGNDNRSAAMVGQTPFGPNGAIRMFCLCFNIQHAILI